MGSLIELLRALEASQGATELMGRTRMQRALPIHARDKLRGWLEPLERHVARLKELRPRLLVVQFGGPVGVRGDLDGKGDAIAQHGFRHLQSPPARWPPHPRSAIARESPEFVGLDPLQTVRALDHVSLSVRIAADRKRNVVVAQLRDEIVDLGRR